MDLFDVTGFRRPTDRDQLRLAPGETLLGGGTWLFSEPQPGTTGLVDLTALGWPAWEVSDGGVSVAATCTIEQLLAMAVSEPAAHGIADLVRASADAFLMSFKIQHAATVGGNLCLALPAGAMTSLTAGLGATAVVWTPDGGERREPVATFVRGVQQTTLGAGEVLRSVELPAAGLRARTAIRRTSLSPHGRSAAVVVGRAEHDGVVLTVTASTTRPVVALVAPVAPRGGPEAAVAGAREALGAVDCWFDDPHGPADWREHVTAVLAAEVWRELSA